MPILTEAERTRLYENVRNCSSCRVVRNLSRIKRRKLYYIQVDETLCVTPKTNIWRRRRQRVRRDDDKASNVSDDDDSSSIASGILEEFYCKIEQLQNGRESRRRLRL